VSASLNWWRTEARHGLQAFVNKLSGKSGDSFKVELPDGQRFQGGSGTPAFTVVFRNDAAIVATLARGHIGLLESYFDENVEVQGDLGAAFAAAMSAGFDSQFRPWNAVENGLHEWLHSNASPAQAKSNARAHYGLGVEFYRLWLDDPLLMYTCGYWPAGTRTLEQAQQQKIDHVCRKLQLALETTGATGTGINTTTEQVDWLRAEIERRGLQQQLDLREADFREVSGQYDKVVSIGVLEHAGRDQLGEVVRAHADHLKPGGLGMLHFIGHVGRYDTELFIRKHVFPGGWIPSLAETIAEMERCGLEVLGVENLRRHYAPTLDAWAERFDHRWVEINALDPAHFNERFRRIWRSYLVGCAEMFRSPAGYTHLFQILFSKGNATATSYPMSMAHVYPR
jgi:cyclopropane-fatty-acyl-phospholipid synthase